MSDVPSWLNEDNAKAVAGNKHAQALGNYLSIYIYISMCVCVCVCVIYLPTLTLFSFPNHLSYLSILSILSYPILSYLQPRTPESKLQSSITLRRRWGSLPLPLLPARHLPGLTPKPAETLPLLAPRELTSPRRPASSSIDSTSSSAYYTCLHRSSSASAPVSPSSIRRTWAQYSSLSTLSSSPY